MIMTLAELTAIIKIADKKQIERHLDELDYIDCKKCKDLRNLNLETLFNGNFEETDTFPDGKDKRTYQGGIFTQIKGYEQLEFTVVNINDHKNAFPIDMLIWAKEIKNA